MDTVAVLKAPRRRLSCDSAVLRPLALCLRALEGGAWQDLLAAEIVVRVWATSGARSKEPQKRRRARQRILPRSLPTQPC